LLDKVRRKIGRWSESICLPLIQHAGTSYREYG